MSLTALVLVLAAAASHAGWNLLAKRAGGGPVFVWLCAVVGAALWAPVVVAAMLISPPGMEPEALLWLSGSAVLHTCYYLALQAGYRRGDLSVVYPVARGTGALLAVAAAVVVLGERPTPLSLLGAALIGVGILSLSGSTRRAVPGRIADTLPAVGIGALIAVYTVWDAFLVTDLGVPALILVWAADVGRVGLLAPLARRRSAQIRPVWRTWRREVVGVAALSPLAYVLVLVALRYAPVSYVAPMREVSIVIAVMFGWRLLNEPDVARRLAAAATVLAGMVLATVG